MTRDDAALTRAERVLVALPRHEARQDRAERVRARCHQQFARRPRVRTGPAFGAAPRIRVSARTALAGALGFVYLATVIRRALHLWGF